MFSNTLLKMFKSTGFRLSIWYVVFFILGSSFLLIVAYFFLSSSLKEREIHSISTELEELISQYNRGGMTLVEKEVLEDIKFRGKNPFFVRITSGSNQTVRIFFQELWRDFDLNELEKLTLKQDKSWIHLRSKENDYELLLISKSLNEGYRLQVGLSTENQEKTLDRFREALIMITIPLFLLGIIGGSLLAFRSLTPIRQIIKTVKSIEIGMMEARVPQTHTGDELDELSRLFNEMLDRINSLISGMRNALDTVAHDLRTPMTRMRNNLENALQVNLKDGEYRTALQEGIEESDHILKMLNVLMDISQAETGTLKLNKSEVNITSLLDRIVDMYQDVAEEKSIIITIHASDGLAATIDEERISQVLANLLDNAIKYSSPEKEIHVKANGFQNEVVISIQDEGHGISEKDLPKIWDRLFRSDQSRKKRGLGLGLSMVKLVVEAHKGRVDVASSPGKGSTFSIHLPLV